MIIYRFNKLQLVLFLAILPFFIGGEILMYDAIGQEKGTSVNYFTIHHPSTYYTIDDFIFVTIVYIIGWSFILIMAGFEIINKKGDVK